jgi:uncharacterized protein (DUF2141 family)
MKFTKTLAITASLVATLLTPKLLAAQLSVTLDNIKEIKGQLYVSLYNNEANFASNSDPVKRLKLTITSDTMLLDLGDIPTGVYAIKIYQDLNSNGKFDFKPGLLPGEPYASSSNSTGFSPPNFSSAQFELTHDKILTIALKH